MRRRLFLALTMALFLALTGGLPALGGAGGANQAVIANSTANDGSISRSGLQLSSTGSPTVGSENLALARSFDCTGCRSTAVAFQTVALTGDPNDVRPTNAAVAANANCDGCRSYAYAYQYVLTTGGPVLLSPAGRAELTELRSLIASLAASGLPEQELTERLDEAKERFRHLIDRELLAAGRAAGGMEERRIEVVGS